MLVAARVATSTFQNLALRPHDERLAVGHPLVIRIHTEGRPRLHLVLAQAVPHRALLAARQVLHEENGLGANAVHIGQALAVGRHLRTHRTAGAFDDVLHFARLAIGTPDHVDLAVGILVVLEVRPRAQVFAEEDVASVARDARLAHVLLVVAAFGNLQSFAAALVVKPHLARTQRARAREVLLRHQELSVGRPHRVVDQTKIFLRDLLRVGAVALHDPDVVGAVLVGGVADAGAVGREARLHFECGSSAQQRRFAARDRDHIDVAQQIEHDFFSVGRDVEVHPRPLVGVEFNGLGWTERGFDVPLLVVFLLGCVGGEDVRRDDQQGACDGETLGGHDGSLNGWFLERWAGL